jgi:hypothetical protein
MFFDRGKFAGSVTVACDQHRERSPLSEAFSNQHRSVNMNMKKFRVGFQQKGEKFFNFPARWNRIFHLPSSSQSVESFSLFLKCTRTFPLLEMNPDSESCCRKWGKKLVN